MDAFARGLRNAARMQQEAVLSKAKADRYKSYKSGIGAKIEAGTTSLEELEVCMLGQYFVGVVFCQSAKLAFSST